MTDKPTKSDRPQSGGSSSGKNASTTPHPGLTTGEPARRDLNAKTDSATPRADASKTPDKSGKLNRTSSAGHCVEDAGTHRKDMRADDTTMSSGSCSPGEHLEPANQRDRKSQPKQQTKNAQPANIAGKSENERRAADRQLETKPTRTPEKR